MKSYRILSALCLSILVFTSQAAAPVERSVSPSGQFIIYGGEPSWRGAISDVAERTKSNLLALLRRRDGWATPVVINLQSRAANLPEIPASTLRFSQTGSGLKLQLDLTLSREMDSALMERELLRAILLENIYRNHTAIAVGESYVEPPSWLIEGLLALGPNRGRVPLVNALAATEKITLLEEFLRQQPELLDSAGRLLYRGYSFALVQWLVESADGRARLGRYIDNLSFASNEPLADLQAAFPDLAGNDFEKTWRSKIVSSKRSTDLLTFSESEDKLTELLRTKFPSFDGRAKSLALEELCQKKVARPQQLALEKFAQELVLLASHANPVLRPIVQDYQQLAAQLSLGKNHGVAARLAELRNLQARLSARMTEVDDYLNWFEATQLKTRSGVFDDYLKSEIQSRTSARHRNDALSVYLDAVEQQF